MFIDIILYKQYIACLHHKYKTHAKKIHLTLWVWVNINANLTISTSIIIKLHLRNSKYSYILIWCCHTRSVTVYSHNLHIKPLLLAVWQITRVGRRERALRYRRHRVLNVFAIDIFTRYIFTIICRLLVFLTKKKKTNRRKKNHKHINVYRCSQLRKNKR